MDDSDVRAARERAQAGCAQKYHQKNAEQGKLFARERITRLTDPDSFVEDASLANALADELPADGVVTGVGRVAGRMVAILANDAIV